MTITGINGSVSVVEGMKNLFKENAKVSFTAAADTAQKQVTNGTILAGRLGVTQGYLTYRYLVVDIEKQTAYRVIIDAGNGEILYTSQGHQIGSFSQQQEPRMFGPFMAGGFGHCNVTHQSFGSEAGDFWHGGSFGHCGADKKAECPRFEETKYIQHQLKPTNACVQDLIKSGAYSIIQRS